MSYETEVLDLFAEANPVHDDEAMDLTDIEPAAYLATLQKRSSEVTQLDEKTRDISKTSNRWLIPAAIAAIVIGVVVVILLQGSEQELPVITQPPTPTTTANETPTTVDQAEALWQAIPTWTDSAGTFRTAVYPSPFSFTVPTDWFQPPGGSTETSYVIQMLDMSPIRIIFLTTDMAPEDIVAEYATAHDAFPEAEMTEPAPTEIGGAEGLTFDSVGMPFQVEDPSVVPFVGEDYLLDPGMGGPGGGSLPPILGAGKATFHIVDVDGVTNLVVYQGIPDHYDEFQDAAQEFFDSVVWKTLG